MCIYGTSLRTCVVLGGAWCVLGSAWRVLGGPFLCNLPSLGVLAAKHVVSCPIALAQIVSYCMCIIYIYIYIYICIFIYISKYISV